MGCNVTGKERRLEINSVLLLVGLEDVVVLDATAAEASSDAQNGVKLISLGHRRPQKSPNLELHGLVGLHEDVGGCAGVVSDVDGDGFPAATAERIDQCSAERAISSDDQTLTGLHTSCLFNNL